MRRSTIQTSKDVPRAERITQRKQPLQFLQIAMQDKTPDLAGTQVAHEPLCTLVESRPGNVSLTFSQFSTNGVVFSGSHLNQTIEAGDIIGVTPGSSPYQAGGIELLALIPGRHMSSWRSNELYVPVPLMCRNSRLFLWESGGDGHHGSTLW